MLMLVLVLGLMVVVDGGLQDRLSKADDRRRRLTAFVAAANDDDDDADDDD